MMLSHVRKITLLESNTLLSNPLLLYRKRLSRRVKARNPLRCTKGTSLLVSGYFI